MQREPEMGCRIAIGSMTQAMKGQRMLTACGVRTEVVKGESSEASRGCAYALRYGCSQDIIVRRVLADAGMLTRGSGG